MLFFRVEHFSYKNQYLKSYAKNCSNNSDFDICFGPWSLLDLFSKEEAVYIASISINHALPYYKKNRPFDKEINKVVMGSFGKADSLIKENFIFGCQSKHLINRYFPNKFRDILNKKGFSVGIYDSNHIHSSQFQSVMNIDQSFEFLGSQKLI